MARLPNEYQEVEWIGIGSQGAYILTDITGNSAYTFKCKCSFSSIAGQRYVFGSYNNSMRCGVGTTANTFEVGAGSTYPGVCAISFDYTPYEFECNIQSGYLKVDSTNYSFRGQTFNNQYDVALFMRNRPTADRKSYSGDRIYYWEAWDGDTQLANYIPCYRISDSEIGMYDLVSDTFKTKQGTGTFIKGENVYGPFENISAISFDGKDVKKIEIDSNVIWQKRGIPSGYQQVEWIGVTTQIGTNEAHIVTDVQSKFGNAYEIKFCMAEEYYGFTVILGAYTTGRDAVTQEGNRYCGVCSLGMSTAYVTSQLCSLDTLITVYHENTATGLTTVNGTTYNIPASNIIDNTTYTIFGRHRASTTDSTQRAKKVFYAKFWDVANDRLTAHYVPCYVTDASTGYAVGTIGMYDIVNNVFKSNAGTGTFTKGADV